MKIPSYPYALIHLRAQAGISKPSYYSSRNGLTLIETLIATLITVIAIVAILEAYQYDLFLSRTSRGISVALSDVRDVMERIACTPFNDITTNFPNNVAEEGRQ